MKPGYKVICINAGEIEYRDSDGDPLTLPPVPELTEGEVYTVEKVLLAEDTDFSFDRIYLREESGVSRAAYHARRFDLYGF